VPSGEVLPETVATRWAAPTEGLVPTSDVVVVTCWFSVKLLVGSDVGAPQTPPWAGVASCWNPDASISGRAAVEHTNPSSPKTAWMVGLPRSAPRTTS
jgi:hypothetical protein